MRHQVFFLSTCFRYDARQQNMLDDVQIQQVPCPLAHSQVRLQTKMSGFHQICLLQGHLSIILSVWQMASLMSSIHLVESWYHAEHPQHRGRFVAWENKNFLQTRQVKG